MSIQDIKVDPHVQNTDTKLDEDGTNEVSASEILVGLKNIMVNAFRIAVNGSLTQFNMIDGIVDEYEDESGIDTTSSTNEDYDSTDDYYSPSGGGQVSVSPYAHYKCNDDAGNTTVTDDGTGANNGTSSTNTSNLSVSGKINDAFEFNGSSEYINIDALKVDIGSDTTGSFSFWVNMNSEQNGNIFCFGDTNTDNYLRCTIYSNNRMVLYFGYTGGIGAYWYKENIAFNAQSTWKHVAIVQDGTAVKLYIDGSLNCTLNTGDDLTAWFADCSGIDNGRIGCANYNNNGNVTFLNGKLDDFRYYSGTALSSNDVSAIYNSGSGTEDDKPAGEINNMTLISDTFIAESAPDNGRIVILEEDVDAVTLNTDLKAYMSIDGGSNWHQGTLSDEGDYDTDKRILTAEFDVSDETDTDIEYKLETLNNKDLKLHGTALSWD